MGWTNRIDAGAHQSIDCEKPDPQTEHAAPGSTWQCPACSREWRFDGMQDDGRNAMYPKWSELPSGASNPAEMWSNLLVNLDDPR